MAKTFYLCIIAVGLLRTFVVGGIFGSFGLTLTARQSLNELNRLTFVEHDRIFHYYTSARGRTVRDGYAVQITAKARRRQSNKLCRDMKEQGVLSKRQYKLCRKDSGMAHTLVTAYKDMFAQCKEQFQNERWNCQGQSSRLKILSQDLREKAFLEALTSAALAVTIARACDLGQLVTCGCSPQELESRGCENSLKYGQSLAKRFLRKKESSNQNPNRYSHTLTRHNTNLGIKIVGATAKQECRCHGISTSCTTKTCWTRVPSLNIVAAALKTSYDSAFQVDEFKNSHNTWRVPGESPSKLSSASDKLYAVDNRKIHALDMVYIEHSPDFCNLSAYGPGTAGRGCNLQNNTCSMLCCGRGYSQVVVEVTRRCKCVTQWCCKVKCEQCIHNETRMQCN